MKKNRATEKCGSKKSGHWKVRLHLVAFWQLVSHAQALVNCEMLTRGSSRSERLGAAA